MRRTLLQHPGHTTSLGNLSKAHGFKENEVRALCADFPNLIVIEHKPPGNREGRPTELGRLILITDTDRRPAGPHAS